jgi:hypothetical protein
VPDPWFASPLAPCDEEELLWNFAFSETHSESRHGDAWRRELGDHLTGIVDRGARGELSFEDWQRLREILLEVRGWYVQDLLKFRPRYYRAQLRTERLGKLRLIRHEPFRAIAPALMLDEFVRALDAGRDTPGDRFAGRYLRLRDRFEPDRARGLPMIAGAGPEGPFTEFDGLTRMSILWSQRARGATVPDALEVLVALSPRIAEWPYF